MLIAIPVLALMLAFRSGLQFKEEDGKVNLYDDGQLIFGYQVETKSMDGQYPRANYIHPLNDFSGSSLTEDFPDDHLHHRGIFWTWHQLYLKSQSLADPWICEGIQWRVHNTDYRIDGDAAVLNASVDWLIGDDQQKMLSEAVEIRYQNYGDYYVLDFDIDLQSLQDQLEIGGSADNKGYGGFSARLALGDAVHFSDASGEVVPDNGQVHAGNWILVTDIGENESEVAIMYHPESTASLKGWILRSSGSMQNPVWPGRDRVVLDYGEAFSMEARLVVFKDKAGSEELARIYGDYSRHTLRTPEKIPDH